MTFMAATIDFPGFFIEYWGGAIEKKVFVSRLRMHYNGRASSGHRFTTTRSQP
jgi:hypothetical protein